MLNRSDSCWLGKLESEVAYAWPTSGQRPISGGITNSLAYQWSTVAYVEKPRVVGSRIRCSYIFCISEVYYLGSGIGFDTDSDEENGDKDIGDQREVCHLTKTKSSGFCVMAAALYLAIFQFRSRKCRGHVTRQVP